MELTRSAPARNRGPRSSSRCWADVTESDDPWARNGPVTLPADRSGASCHLRDVGSFTTVNLQGRYNFTETIKFLVTVDNALDEEVPFAVGDGNNDLYGYVQSTHNPRGRFWSARAVFTF